MMTASQIQDDNKRVLAALWRWLRRTASRVGAEMTRDDPAAESESGTRHRMGETGTVLRFPLRGEALLVRLAELLRKRVAELEPRAEETLLLTLSHQPLLCLTIDDSAYVEFQAASAEFNLVIDAPSGTRMILQTRDFDAVVRFVLQYILERLADNATLEAAS